MPSKSSARLSGGMTFSEIARREGISRARAHQVFRSGMKKLRGIPRRDLVMVLKFYGDALEQARRGVVPPEAML